MQALVLAAGKGLRLSNATEEPKPLIRVAGRTLLERIISNLKKAGVDRVILVVGYKQDVIRKEIAKWDQRDEEILLVENKEWRKGNLYSLLAAEPYVNDVFLLCMCDHVGDVHRILKSLIRVKPSSAVLLAADPSEAREEDTRVLVSNELIIDIGKNVADGNYVDTGFFLCSREVFRYAKMAAREGKVELADCIKKAASYGRARILNISKIEEYDPKLRRRVPLFWVDCDTIDDIERAKRGLVQNAQKGASDLLAHYIHQPIENRLVYWLSDTRVTPNQLTILTNVIAYVVAALFYFGYLLPGSLLSFAVGIMDGLDGKLARVRETSSKTGSMEHAFDLLFESIWVVSLSIYLHKSGHETALLLCAIILVLVAFYRKCYDQFRVAAGRSLDDYGPFERRFRRVAGRRNLYNVHILLWIVLGTPFLSLITIAGHALITAAVYAYRSLLNIHRLDTGKG
ncbi:MAG: NTP transferase domain-containing protein [Candidatus Bathyarchaeia archaeon]